MSAASNRPAGRPGSVVIQLDRRALLLLVIVISLLVGFVGGYLTSGSASVNHHRAAAHASCSFQLPPSQQYIVAGLRCPSDGGADAIADCHCDECHRIQGMVKDQLLQGRSPEEIRSDIIKRYGDVVSPKS